MRSVRFLLLACACACGRLQFDPVLDASTDTATDGVAPPLGPFGPFFGTTYQAQLSSPQREYGSTISDDGLELYWSTFRTPNAGGSDLWRATRPDRSAVFANAAVVGALASNLDDGEPTLSRDGLTMYLQRPGLFFTTRTDTTSVAWSVPIMLDQGGNLNGFNGADIGRGDLRLYLQATTGSELYEATRPDTSSQWGVPQVIPGLGGMLDGVPAIRPDGLEIFWESDRAQPKAIWHALRLALDQPFGAAEKLSLGMNVDGFQCGDPDITADGRTLVFVSTAANTGDYDVWTAERAPL